MINNKLNELRCLFGLGDNPPSVGKVHKLCNNIVMVAVQMISGEKDSFRAQDYLWKDSWSKLNDTGSACGQEETKG